MFARLTLEDICIIACLSCKMIKRNSDTILSPGILKKIRLVFSLKHLQELEIFLLNQKLAIDHQARNAERNTQRAEEFWEKVIFKLRLGALIPRSVGLSVYRYIGLSVLQKLQKNYDSVKEAPAYCQSFLDGLHI